MFPISPITPVLWITVRARFTRLWFLLICSLLCLWIMESHIAHAGEPLIDINTASPALLAERLPGIGPAKAKAIIVYRELHGPFKTLDLLMAVKGIGPRTLEKIRPLIFVDQLVTHNDTVKTEKPQVNKDRSTRNAVRAAVNIAKRYESN